MSPNEFVLGLVGVVIGLGIADLLTSFHKLLRAGSRVKWDWLTLTYAALMLFVLIVFWWWQFGYPGEGRTLTIAGFLTNFVFLAVSFLMVASALPDDVPAEGLDLREFYSGTLRLRWSLVTMSLVLSLATAIPYLVSQGTWQDLQWLSLPFGSVILAAMAMHIRATWFQLLAIGWIFGVTIHGNLFLAIGP